MIRLFAAFLTFLFLTASVFSEEQFLSGKYQVINTAGFLETSNERRPLERDRSVGIAEIRQVTDNRLQIGINGTKLNLFPIENGLAALEWDSTGTGLLHRTDLQALLKTSDRSKIPAWGADIAWPGIETARMVLFPLRTNAYAGFLISQPHGNTIVRQMEFRQVFGPTNRPRMPSG